MCVCVDIWNENAFDWWTDDPLTAQWREERGEGSWHKPMKFEIVYADAPGRSFGEVNRESEKEIEKKRNVN